MCFNFVMRNCGVFIPTVSLLVRAGLGYNMLMNYFLLSLGDLHDFSCNGRIQMSQPILQLYSLTLIPPSSPIHRFYIPDSPAHAWFTAITSLLEIIGLLVNDINKISSPKAQPLN
jgi:uncharacterized membrane protein YqaE (UPF0057 family)